MAIKKGDLVKVIELIGNDEFCGVELDKTYKVLSVGNNYLEIDAGKGDRCMFYSQIETVKKKRKKDLRIEELENTIKQMKDILKRIETMIITKEHQEKAVAKYNEEKHRTVSEHFAFIDGINAMWEIVNSKAIQEFKQLKERKQLNN